MHTIAPVSDTRLRAWAILARAALTATAYADVVVATRAVAPDIEAAAEQIGARTAGPDSRDSLAALADRDLVRAERAGAWLLTPDDPAWTGLGFDDLDARDSRYLEAPIAVWVRGTIDPVSVLTRVGVIGTQAVTPYGAALTSEIAGALAARGVHIVSGGSYGVDVLAHRTALDHGVPTTLVSAAGIDRVYPTSLAQVFDAVTETGAIVSEYPPCEEIDRARLIARNRLVAAMSRQLVIPEAGVRSGTLSTARWARRLHRPVLAVPGPTAASRGCGQLISDGHARPVHSVADVLAALDETADPEPRHPHSCIPRFGSGRDRIEDATVR
ncbi:MULTISPECIES: DNA-processing protein DprA [Nocardia]|uniref:DNA-processing protein DprA n=1 Tax=Nocardia TaxID=1817 RepID=UPI0013001B5D|nr:MULTISPECIES: DNA-processing protein DprA [Nocardia]